MSAVLDPSTTTVNSMSVVPARKFGRSGGDCASPGDAQETDEEQRHAQNPASHPASIGPAKPDTTDKLTLTGGFPTAACRARRTGRSCDRARSGAPASYPASIVHIFENRTIDGFTACCGFSLMVIVAPSRRTRVHSFALRSPNAISRSVTGAPLTRL